MDGVELRFIARLILVVAVAGMVAPSGTEMEPVAPFVFTVPLAALQP